MTSETSDARSRSSGRPKGRYVLYVIHIISITISLSGFSKRIRVSILLQEEYLRQRDRDNLALRAFFDTLRERNRGGFVPDLGVGVPTAYTSDNDIMLHYSY